MLKIVAVFLISTNLPIAFATADLQSIISSIVPNKQEGFPQIPFLNELFGHKGESSSISAHWWYGFYPVAYLTATVICISILIWISIRTVKFYQINYADADSLFRDNESSSVTRKLANTFHLILEVVHVQSIQSADGTTIIVIPSISGTTSESSGWEKALSVAMFFFIGFCGMVLLWIFIRINYFQNNPSLGYKRSLPSSLDLDRLVHQVWKGVSQSF